MMPKRLLLDLNVVLDVLARRQPHYGDSAAVWARVETGQVEGLIAAHSLTTLFYLLSHHVSHIAATRALRDMLSVFSVAAVDGAVINRALDLDWTDFEDAVQMAAAAQAGVDYLVTRNPKDFKVEIVPVILPAEMTALLDTEGISDQNTLG
jgi:predicted nucleic acid-binding protein